MFVLSHSIRALLAIVCALIIVNALPTVVRSQVTEDVTEAPAIPLTTEAPYPIERVPGGDAVVGDFVVGPGKADVTIAPGDSKIVYMTVTNRTGERRRFNVTVEDAMGTNDPDTPIKLLGDDRGPYSLRDYLSFPAKSFELGQNERARIPVTVSIPADAEPGGKYGSVLIDTVALESNVGDTEDTVPQSAIIARIGTIFFVTIPGEIAHDAYLKEFGTLGKQRIFGSGPIPFGILMANRGSIHVAPYGEVRITNMLGEEVGAVELESWFVLPQSERLRELSWDREFMFGRYTATAHINRSYDDIIDTESFTFWVLPWKPLALGFAALFVILFIIRGFFKTFEFKRKT
jgi:hypothetical protein